MRTSTGLTMVIDTGLPTGAFTDLIASHGQYIDLVKFGWGTALITQDLDRKAAALTDAGIGFYFGGTLFEHHLWTGHLDGYLRLVERTGATHIEVSNGTIPLDQHMKAEYVRRMSRYRPVLSEVGYKDSQSGSCTQGCRNADRAHLHPHASAREGVGHCAVEHHRVDGLGGGQHRNHHRCALDRLPPRRRDHRTRIPERASRRIRTIPHRGGHACGNEIASHRRPHDAGADHRDPRRGTAAIRARHNGSFPARAPRTLR